MDKRAAGDRSEAFVIERILGKKHRIIIRNFQCRYGELDLVCFDERQKILLIIEIRSRRQDAMPDFGDLALGISKSKIQKIKKTAAKYIQDNPGWLDYAIRFDVILLLYSADNVVDNYRWIEDAFR